MSVPVVSIITATFNSSLSIESCIKSVLSQSYGAVQHIIIDGGSTDGTVDIIRSLTDSTNTFILSERDDGIYDALNKGILLATGQIIGFLHSDDVFASHDSIESVVKGFTGPNVSKLRLSRIGPNEDLMSANHECNSFSVDGVYGDLVYLHPKSDQLPPLRYWQSQDFTKSLLWRGWMPPHPTLFLLKSVYDNVGNFNKSYQISADYDFILRVFSDDSRKFVYIPRVVVKMMPGGASNKSIKNICIKTREDYTILVSNNFGIFRSFLIVLKKNLSKVKQFL